MNRREMLKQTGVMGTGLVLGGVMGACATTPGMSQGPNQDVAILNFALNLEYLEAAFYLAAVGRINEIRSIGGNAEIRLPSGFDGTSPVPGLSQDVLEYAEEIAEDELAHVKFLRQALGSAAVNRPVIDLDQAFRDAGSAASRGAITNFNPFANELFFIHGAFIFLRVLPHSSTPAIFRSTRLRMRLWTSRMRFTRATRPQKDRASIRCSPKDRTITLNRVSIQFLTLPIPSPPSFLP
jgi:hypothetical protein